MNKIKKVVEYIRKIFNIMFYIINVVLRTWCLSVLTAVCFQFGWYPVEKIEKVRMTEFHNIFNVVLAFIILYDFLKRFVLWDSNMTQSYKTEATGYAIIETDNIHKYDEYTNRTIVIHEAAHAVVAEKLGFHVSEISVIPNGCSVGHITVEEFKNELANEKSVSGNIKVLMAGVIAEQLFCNKINMNCSQTQDADLTRIDNFLHHFVMLTNQDMPLTSKMDEPDIEKEEKRLNIQFRKEVVELLNEHKTQIMELADELESKKIIKNKITS